MVEPQTGVATSASGKEVRVPAKDASTVVDYTSIQAKAADVKKVAYDSLDAVAEKARNINAGGEVLSVEDKKLQPLIEEVADYIGTLAESGIYESLESATETALKVHDQFQEEYNEEAQQEAERKAAITE